MTFELSKAIEILERTPSVLNHLIKNLSEEWTSNNEGKETWSPFDVVGHLIHGENTDWIPRTKIVLNGDREVKFTPFDRFAQYEFSKGKSLHDLLTEFEVVRYENLEQLKSFNIQPTDLEKEATHPELGIVSLRNLLSSWVVHDLGHIAQISRVMAKQYSSEIGPWHQYMGILK
jgi:hypothetical protein